MRDGTIINFINDYNEFKRFMETHITLTDYRDFETNMYMKALYSMLIKIPLFKIFFNHQLTQIAKKRREVDNRRAGEIARQLKQKEFADKIKI